DRALRFVGVSAVIWTIYLPLGYLVWEKHVHDRIGPHPIGWLQSHAASGDAFAWWLYFLPALYFFTPVVAGTLVGRGVQSNHAAAKRAALVFAGRDPAPRAWDALFSRRPYALVRALMKDEEWVGGLFARNSYAAGFPNAPDLLLE